MKKNLFTISFAIFFVGSLFAQNFLKQVPSTASIVINYAGENLLNSVSLKKLNGYHFVKTSLLQALHIDTLTNLETTGINFSGNHIQYMTAGDSCTNFVSLLSLKNESEFAAMVKKNYAAKKQPVAFKGFNFIALSDDTYLAWNKNTAIMVFSTYNNPKKYYEERQATEVGPVAVDSVRVDATAEATEQDDEMSNEESEAASAAETAASTEKYRIEDSIYNAKMERWEKEQKEIASIKQLAAAKNIIQSLAGTIKSSMAENVSYKKIIDAQAPISVWINADHLMSQYGGMMMQLVGGLSSSARLNDGKEDGFMSGMNVYFDKEKVRMETKTYSPNKATNDLLLNMMNSQQNKTIANYINEDNIGYFSSSINTEEAAKYYYHFIKSYLRNSGYLANYSDIADIYVDLMEIVLDEKSIAELMTGNSLFVMHDLKPRTVEYTDYTYDADYNATPVQKTKEEMSPDFSFIFETKRDDFMERLARLPLKYADEKNYVYLDKNGYYELNLEEEKTLIPSLYFMVKDHKAIITTSLAVIDHARKNTGFALSAEIKSKVNDYNYAMNLNTQRMLGKMSTLFDTESKKEYLNTLKKNFGDVKMESSVKEGMVQGSVTMNIAGEHANSLEFFFNMIETLNDIDKKNKENKEKEIAPTEDVANAHE